MDKNIILDFLIRSYDKRSNHDISDYNSFIVNNFDFI